MAKFWFSYTIAAPFAPERNYTANYVYVKNPPACNNTTRPCAIFANGSAGTTAGSHPLGTTISANLQSYLTSAIGSQIKWPAIGQPFVYLKA